jgi:hypothetical protein
VLRWRAANHRAYAVTTRTLAKLWVCLLAKLSEAEQRRWTGGVRPTSVPSVALLSSAVMSRCF